jgi:hypothetical protein
VPLLIVVWYYMCVLYTIVAHPSALLAAHSHDTIQLQVDEHLKGASSYNHVPVVVAALAYYPSTACATQITD